MGFSREDSLVLSGPADDEPDLHWHCLAKALVHFRGSAVSKWRRKEKMTGGAAFDLI